MFQFPGCPPTKLWIHFVVTGYCPRRVSPFGDPGILSLACSSPRLFAAGHVLLRQSVPKASTLCSYSLDLKPSSHRSPSELAPLRFPAPFRLLTFICYASCTIAYASLISSLFLCAVVKVRLRFFSLFSEAILSAVSSRYCLYYPAAAPYSRNRRLRRRFRFQSPVRRLVIETIPSVSEPPGNSSEFQANAVFLLIVERLSSLSTTGAAGHLGGLKWTRTTDLALIRRVL